MSAARKLGLATLALCSLAGVSTSYWLLFQAGRAGDPKTGATGDPVRALHLEAVAELPLLVGIAAATAIVGIVSGRVVSGRDRIPMALGFSFLALASLWILGVQIELWGTQGAQ